MSLFLEVVLYIDPLDEDNVAVPVSTLGPSCNRPRPKCSVEYLALFDLTNLENLPKGQVEVVEVSVEVTCLKGAVLIAIDLGRLISFS